MKISYIVIFYITFNLLYSYSAFANNTQTIKNELLNDPTFIKSLSEKINPEAIEKTIKEFFLKNPEFILKIQENLLEKQHSQLETERYNILKNILPTIYNAKEDLLLGNAKAKHTIVEFLDFNCGYCKKSYLITENLLKNHPDFKIIVKELPILGTNSVAAHTISRAFHKLLPNKQNMFVHNIMNLSEPATENSALKIAQSLGAKSEAIENMMKDQKQKLKLQEYLLNNVKLAMALKIQGTPAYIIDGKLFEGVIDLESIMNKTSEKNT